jgi:hypothetical protein
MPVNAFADLDYESVDRASDIGDQPSEADPFTDALTRHLRAPRGQSPGAGYDALRTGDPTGAARSAPGFRTAPPAAHRFGPYDQTSSSGPSRPRPAGGRSGQGRSSSGQPVEILNAQMTHNVVATHPVTGQSSTPAPDADMGATRTSPSGHAPPWAGQPTNIGADLSAAASQTGVHAENLYRQNRPFSEIPLSERLWPPTPPQAQPSMTHNIGNSSELSVAAAAMQPDVAAIGRVIDRMKPDVTYTQRARWQADGGDGSTDSLARMPSPPGSSSHSPFGPPDANTGKRRAQLTPPGAPPPIQTRQRGEDPQNYIVTTSGAGPNRAPASVMDHSALDRFAAQHSSSVDARQPPAPDPALPSRPTQRVKSREIQTYVLENPDALVTKLVETVQKQFGENVSDATIERWRKNTSLLPSEQEGADIAKSLREGRSLKDVQADFPHIQRTAIREARNNAVIKYHDERLAVHKTNGKKNPMTLAKSDMARKFGVSRKFVSELAYTDARRKQTTSRG